MRRLYYLFPDVAHSQTVVDELLVKRIEIQHMHVVAKDGTDLKNLPEANLMQTTDLRHSLFLGLIAGIFLGVGISAAFHTFLDLAYGGITIVMLLIGAILGVWGASMIGMTTPNSELKKFEQEVEDGKILLILDIPKPRVDEIEALIEKLHPEASFSGVEPTVPPFP